MTTTESFFSDSIDEEPDPHIYETWTEHESKKIWVLSHH